MEQELINKENDNLSKLDNKGRSYATGKRKTSVVPAAILAAGGTAAGAKAFADNAAMRRETPALISGEVKVVAFNLDLKL